MNQQLTQQSRPTSQRTTATRSHPSSQHAHHSHDEEPPASPHRAGFTARLHPEDTPYTSSEQSTRPPSSRTTLRPVPVPVEDAETLDDGSLYPQRMPSSIRRYWPVEEQGQDRTELEPQQATRMVQPTSPQTMVRYHRQQIPLRSSRTQDHAFPVPQATKMRPPEPVTTPLVKRKRRHQMHWLVYVGLTILAGVIVFVIVSLALSWWQGYQDDLHFGRPRTYQCDAWVGHNDAHTPSHFIALNLHKHIEVIEFPGGDAAKAYVYPGPILVGDGQDLTPVTLSFKDVNGDGKPDMLLHIGTQSTIVYINDNGVFRPATATDHISV